MPAMLPPTVALMSTLSVDDTLSPLLADSCAGSVPLLVSVTSTCDGPSTAVSLVGVKEQLAEVFRATNAVRVAAWACAKAPGMGPLDTDPRFRDNHQDSFVGRCGPICPT